MTDRHNPNRANLAGPSSTAMSSRLPYSQALATLEPQRILELLADDIVMHVAVHDDPLAGKPVAQFLFSVLQQELGPIIITDELVDGESAVAVVLFDTSIGDVAAHGLNIVHYTEAGEIDELTVFFRPLEALATIADVIGGHMQQGSGPRPEKA